MLEEETTTLAEESLFSEAIAFGQGLRDCPEYLGYLRAREGVEGSGTVRRLQEELLDARRAVQRAMNGEADISALLRTLQSKQQQMENLPEMKRYVQAQQQLLDLFESIARQISDAAGVDFVEACPVSGGCCG